MSIATTKHAASPYERRQSTAEVTIIWSGLLIVLLSTSIVAIAISIEASPFMRLLGVAPAAVQPASWAIRLVAATFVFNSLSQTVKSVSIVRLRWRVYTLLDTLAKLCTAAGAPIALYALGGGITTAAFVGMCIASVYLVALFWTSTRLQPELRHPSLTISAVRTLTSYGGALTLAGAVTVPLGNGEVFFLSADKSPKILAFYAVAMTFATTLQVLPEQLGAPLIPAFARLAKPTHTLARAALYKQTLLVLYVGLTPLVIVAALLARPFLTLWAGATYGVHSTPIVLILLCGVWFESFVWFPWNYLVATARVRLVMWLHLAQVPMYLGFAWYIAPRYGAIGVALVWAVRGALDAALFLGVARHLDSLPIDFLPQRKAPSIGLPIGMGGAALWTAAICHTLVLRCIVSLCLLTAYITLFWRVGLTTSERTYALSLIPPRLRSAVSRRRRRGAHFT